MIPQIQKTSDLAKLLRLMADHVEQGDSFEGHIEYSCLDEDCGPGEFGVVAMFRVGNRDGQGGMITVGTMESSAPAASPEEPNI